MTPLITQLQTSLPSEYHLPDEIRNFFKDGVSSRYRLKVD
jgi:hypothetical protein